MNVTQDCLQHFSLGGLTLVQFSSFL